MMSLIVLHSTSLPPVPGISPPSLWMVRRGATLAQDRNTAPSLPEFAQTWNVYPNKMGDKTKHRGDIIGIQPPNNLAIFGCVSI